MKKGRKGHLLFFLILLIPMQLIFLPIGLLADYLVVSWNPTDHLERAGFRAPPIASPGNSTRFLEGEHDALLGPPREPQSPHDCRPPSLAGNPLRRRLPSTVTPNPALKASMRTSITPLLLLSQFLVTSTLTDKVVYLLFVGCYSLCIFSWLIKRHPEI